MGSGTFSFDSNEGRGLKNWEKDPPKFYWIWGRKNRSLPHPRVQGKLVMFFFLLLDSGKEQWEKEYEKRARLVIHLQNLYLPPAMCSFRRYVDQMCPSKPCGFSFHLCTISLLQPSWNFSILQYPAVRSFLTHQMPEEMLSTSSQQLYLMPACYCVKNGNRIAKVTGKRFQTHLWRVGAPLSNLGLRRVL